MYVSSCKSVDMRIDIVKNEQVKARGWTSARFSETPLQTFYNLASSFGLLVTQSTSTSNEQVTIIKIMYIYT